MTFEQYPQFRMLVFKQIHKVHKSIGGDLDEMLANAALLFHKAVTTYDNSRGTSLATWIAKVAWDDTFAERRIEMGRQKRYTRDADLDHQPDRHHFDMNGFLDELSNDARELALLAFNPPKEVKLKLDGTPKQTSLIGYARRAFKWTDEHVRQLSDEITGALK